MSDAAPNATPDDLAFLCRLATLPSTGTIAERNRLIRCARVVAQALGRALEPAPASGADAPARAQEPILGPGDR